MSRIVWNDDESMLIKPGAFSEDSTLNIPNKEGKIVKMRVRSKERQ